MKNHSFHIPVMGIGFTIDTPLKVAQYGMDSVIPLGDDNLLERLRKMYCEKFGMPYQEITDKIEDFRAKRITSYLNLIGELAEKKIEELKSASQEKTKEIKNYFNMLPDGTAVKEEFNKLTSKYFNLSEIKDWLRDNISMGSIDVNIMTKLDKVNYQKGEELPVEFNDSHAGLRGFANSNLKSSVVLSAGMNPRLYGYIENFEDFYPDENGEISKKIILKVSDYRSALIQGKYLAKKGLWVSEYRIESGLNCGGHAFATEGYLLGPILEEFKEKRDELEDSVNAVLTEALKEKGKKVPEQPLNVKITAQGGVGTSEEHQFLIDHYQLDSVGWGSPFLLVPEVTNVDEETRQKLMKAKEKDLYLSNISPLGVPFNSLHGNTKDIEKVEYIKKGRPGSPCPKEHLVFNTEFTDKPICTASRQYQHLKIQDLQQQNLSEEEYQKKYDEVVEKSCICVGLGTSVLLENDLSVKREGPGVSICPGPNMAYFSETISLNKMIDHIYGRSNVISRSDRPNLFIKELRMYLDYFKEKIDQLPSEPSRKEVNSLKKFGNNLNSGIQYYLDLFKSKFGKVSPQIDGEMTELEVGKSTVNDLVMKISSED